jgi:hypothetical protein
MANCEPRAIDERPDAGYEAQTSDPDSIASQTSRGIGTLRLAAQPVCGRTGHRAAVPGSSDQTDASLEMTINWFGFGRVYFIVSPDGYRRLLSPLP